jgi:hypothetical protein
MGSPLPLRQVVLAYRREDFDGDAVGEGAGVVGGAARDAPAVAGLGEVGGVADGVGADPRVCPIRANTWVRPYKRRPATR